MTIPADPPTVAPEARPMSVWAFGSVDDEGEREMIHQSLKGGRSRFGWSSNDENNLKGPTWSDCHTKQLFLLQIKPGDWIVHVNTPHWGRCSAARVVGEYGFDGGIQCEDRIDFRHYIPVDVESLVEFDRRDPNVLPTVNLNLRQRYHRVYAVDDFLQSLANLECKAVELTDSSETRELFHFRAKTKELLGQITAHLQGTHRGKELERFLARVFRKLPGVVNVHENGSGWGTDHGADLIITVRSIVANISLEQTVIVQVKSFVGDHYDIHGIDQVIQGIGKYEAVAGIIVTTAQKTEPLETAINTASQKIGKPIDLIAGDEVAKFVLRHAPELVFEMTSTV